MKTITFLALLWVLGMSCHKSLTTGGPLCPAEQGPFGKWKAVMRYTSTGAGGTWYDLPAGEQFTIEFMADNTIISSPNFPKADSAFTDFSMNGPRLTISSRVNNKTDTWYWRIDDQCRLNLGIFPCIEGCPYALKRVN